jgi:hypothetical protein
MTASNHGVVKLDVCLGEKLTSEATNQAVRYVP